MKSYKYIKIISNIIQALIILSWVLVTASVSAKSDQAKLEDRLEILSQKLEQRRKQYHIPGMALAIVKDNKVIFTKGFGVSDLNSESAVTTDTVFGIGSTTKAFTATLIGMLVDEGKMNWDDPITKYLPELKFKMINEGEIITLRDMMSHQTGFTRFNLLYANGKVAREEILQAATKAEPWAGFREKFLYTNLMVSGAGVAAAKSVNTDWDSLLESRIFKPLGMKNTTSRYAVVQKNKNLAKGYVWLEETNKHKELDMHDLTNIGPAGAINSNVDDMAKWLKLQLNEGRYKGKQIISSQQLKETKIPQVEVGSGVHYGLGWMLSDYNGKKLIAHDGSVEGYSSIVAMLPESNVGFVLLTNVTSTRLLGISPNMIFEVLEDTPIEIKSQKSASETTSYDDYVGEYMANFATFKDTIFTFHLKDGVPYVDVPGQTDYELKAPNEEGKMYFAITDTVAVSFDRNDIGQVSAMRMHQGGLKFEIPKKGVIITPEIDESELRKFLGKYKSDLFKGDITVLIQNTRLTADIPGEMAFELKLPDEKGHRHFRIKENMSVLFDSNVKDEITSLSLFRSDKKIGTALKIVDQTVEPLPTVADILELSQVKKRKELLNNSSGFLLKGQITMKQSGVVGEVTSRFLGNDSFREEIDFGKYGSVTTAVNADQGSIAPSFAAFRELHGKYLLQTQIAHLFSLQDWERYYDEITVTGIDKVNENKVYVIKLSNGKIPLTRVYIDAKNGDILKQETDMLNPTIGSIPVTTFYENFKNINGLSMPFKVTVNNEFNGTSVIEVDSVETGLKFDQNIFILNNPKSGE